MATITVVGTGPGPTAYLTKEAEAELLSANKVFFRTKAHPVYDWLNGLGKHLHSFDVLYTMRWANPEDIYEFMVAALFKEAELTGATVYAVPGSADVLEDTTNLIRIKGRKEGVRVKVISGVSFLDLALAEINFDFTLGLQVVLPLAHLERGLFTKHLGMIVCQIEAAGSTQDAPRVDLTMQFLLKAYEPDHPVTLIWTDGLPDYTSHSKTIPLKDLVREYGETKFFSSLYVPPVKQWDKSQTHS
ncbi:MAG: SAM-dependent methyltransferase [Candidatus Acidiferrum sp.]